jgi:urease gamma subunit
VIDVRPTAEAIDYMAEELVYRAKELQRIAGAMREKKDLLYASEAIQVISNLINQLRLDLLVTRPLREMNRETKEIIKEYYCKAIKRNE